MFKESFVEYGVKILLLVSTVCCGLCFGESLRDPTQPLDFSGKKVGALNLHSILIGRARKVAIINGNSLHEGDTIPGRPNLIVKEIDARYVMVSDHGQLRTLVLSSSLRN